MIPSTTGFLQQDFELTEQPSLTYRMNLSGTDVRGTVDGQEAVKQAVFRILNTERYQYVIYPWWYGIETIDLYGEPVTWVCPELERRIEEALLMDERIISVNDFEFDTTKKGIVHVNFTVNTIFGEVKASREVSI
jgi:beta-galactosidase GanA